MIRTKHFVMALLSVTGAVFLGLFSLPSDIPARPLHASFATPFEAYHVKTQEPSRMADDRTAFIASVRSALLREPPRKKVEPPAPLESPVVSVPFTSDANLGDALVDVPLATSTPTEGETGSTSPAL